VTTTTIAPEVIVEPVQKLGTTGDEDEVDGFSEATASNQMNRFR